MTKNYSRIFLTIYPCGVAVDLERAPNGTWSWHAPSERMGPSMGHQTKEQAAREAAGAIRQRVGA